VRIFKAKHAINYAAMKPQNKLRVANVLMGLGLVPLLIGSCWMFSTLAGIDYQKQSQIGLAFLAIGKVVFAYVFALIVSGSSAVWSVAVEKGNAGPGVGSSRTMRILVAMVLVVPLVLTSLARI
jgi:hypothetical protein